VIVVYILIKQGKMNVKKRLALRIGCLGLLEDGLVVGAFPTYLYVWWMVCYFMEDGPPVASSAFGLF
jgi:hypothetical protein